MSDDKSKKMTVSFTGPIREEDLIKSGIVALEKHQENVFSVVHKEQGPKKNKAPRMAFTENPTDTDSYAGIYKQKSSLLPDYVIKQVRVQNHLIASILRARGNTMAMFGHVRKDRFDIGIEISLKPEFEDIVKPSQMAKIRERISMAEKVLINCGKVGNLKSEDKMSLSDFFYLQAYNGLSFGRFPTEIVRDDKGEFNRFRPVDAGTIFSAANKESSTGDGIRRNSIKLLKDVSKKHGIQLNLDLERLEEGEEYAWIQVINGMPVQAFSNEEMIIYNLYPSTDVEHKGYPVTPIDTCISSITTHLSIDIYNKLYFQNGRAAKGMLVVRSDEIEQGTIDNIKQQFNASINSLNNSFRVPIFGIGKEDEVSWQPMTANAGDGEFQFLYDQVARNILSTFNMSPDELPGYGHLSRGTNQQTLSESSNEFKMTAARDTGLRPLVLKFQAFVNDHIFPLIDEELAQLCTVQFGGLDASTKDQEALRLQQDMPLHMTYDQVMQKVEKDPIGKFLGGDVPLNERIQVVMDKFLDVGFVYSNFMDNPAAQFDPLLQYKRDPFFMQNIQMLMQSNPEAIKAMYAAKPYQLEMLKMVIEDSLEEGEE